MAIYHCSMKPIARASGRSAVGAAAYRCAEKLTNKRDGITHDYTRKQGVVHSEIVLPEGCNADWARDRSALWNAAEAAEKRKDARLAREFEIALPHELSAEQRLETARGFAQDLANRYGAAVDFAIHAPHEASDVRNHHAHMMMTTRGVMEDGLGGKTDIERENKWLLSNGLPTTDMQLRDIRQSWEHVANEYLAQAGLDIRIDHRSHLDRGLEIAPTEHVGVHATQMERRGLHVSRSRLDEGAARRNAELIREKPEQVLSLIAIEKSVFDRHDVARALHRYINNDPQEFQSAFAKVMASPALVELQAERIDQGTGEIALARYSTQEMVEIESGMMTGATRLRQARNHGVDCRHVERAIEAQDAAIQRSAGGTSTASDASARLSDEQRRAIEHITGPERIAAVVGYAGAGKSTMLAVAREAWEAEGYQVHGAALSGKAAEGLEESSGIQSRTLASWEYGWQAGRGELGRGDVFVIDEAGMVGSRQLARFVTEAEARGAKIVLIGDHEQLQAIGAGAPFRAIAEEIGHAELSEIRRQRMDWQREASVQFATHRTDLGLRAYHEHGDIRFSKTREAARGEIVSDYLADRDQRPDGTRVAMAHRRADVQAINEAIRTELQERGELARVKEAEGCEPGGNLAPGDVIHEWEGPGRALIFQTNDGKREFAQGDRIVFLQNNRDLGVKNGMLATVDHVEPGRIIATLDGRGDSVSVPMDDYQSIDYGYATTIHKNQGATVDRSFVLASGTMERHLTYVAMTRHRDRAQLYAAQDEFTDQQAGQTSASGRLVEHGRAPHEHRLGKSDSYFVTLETDNGQRNTIWGVDLERAMKAAKQAPEIGDRIGLEHRGSEPVRLPDGTMVERHAWKVQDAGELAYAQLVNRLSRSGLKETTLDYAEQGGMADRMDVRREIEVRTESSGLGWEWRAAEDRTLERGSSGKIGEDCTQSLRASRREELAQDRGHVRQQRNNPFEGLKLVRGAATKGPQQDRASKTGSQIDQKEPQQADKQRRGMFAGLKLNARSASSQERSDASRMQRQPERGASLRPAAAQDRLAERVRGQSPLEQAVDRYSRAYQSIDQHQREGLPVLDIQRQEMRDAGQQLNQVRDGLKDLMRSALENDPDMQRSMTELSGRQRVGQVIERLDHERAMQADPNVRANRFVERWQELSRQRQRLRGWQHDEARGKVEGQMQGLAKSLERDPQVESILRNRRQEIGIAQHIRQSEGISRELQQSITRGRSIGLER